MPEPVKDSEDLERGLFPIRTVAELTGVNAITLRAWESRYGLVEPIRRESGHRLYTQQHIELINRIVGLLDRGMRIGQVRAKLEAEQDRQASGGDATATDLWQRQRDSMVAAVIRFDEVALEEVYGDALAHYPVRIVTTQLIEPLLVDLGRRWEQGDGTVAEEHFFGFYLRNKLGARFHHRTINANGPKLLMACLPGERHEIGLLLFALASNEAGYQPVILGADMPLVEMAAAGKKVGCQAIVLSGFLNPDKRTLERDLAALSRDSEVPVLIGGRASVAHFDALRRIDVEPIGLSVEAGLRRLAELVPLGK
jgi:DNA-binding transcriptional MerR regulator